ncbi:hypothetical protein AYO44_16295 [Planctomycetaceae bacterium SCGC AG-212-F19]|nr:hypothetical protein AYO44_16295 [Planctomycetaceae bacterium SCGC AG-212-F19]
MLDLEFAEQAKRKKGVLDPSWKNKIKEALEILRREALADVVLDEKQTGTDRAQSLTELRSTDEGKESLAFKLSSTDPASLKDVDFDKAFGDAKGEILAAALDGLRQKKAPAPRDQVNRVYENVPKLFEILKGELLKSDDWPEILKNNPALADSVLSSMDPAEIKKIDFDKAFGKDKHAILGKAMVELARKTGNDDGKPKDRVFDPDPELLKVMTKEMLKSKAGKKAFFDDKPSVASAVLSSMDPAVLNVFDFDDALGKQKNDILLESLAVISKKAIDKDGIPINRDTHAHPKIYDALTKALLDSDQGPQALAANPKLASTVIGSVNATVLKDLDFDKAFGKDKDGILADALETISSRTLPLYGMVKSPLSEADPKLFGFLKDELLKSDKWKEVLKAKPVAAGAVISSMDPDALKDFDFDKTFGDSKDRVLAEALLSIANKPVPMKGNVTDRATQLDPKLFKLLKEKVPKEVWNDQTATIGARKGLGPRVCMGLWRTNSFDQICELIDYGVDTSLATRVPEGERTGGGVYSGFVQPVQHLASKLLHDAALRDQDKKIAKKEDKKTETWEPVRKKQADGAGQILAALEKAATEKKCKLDMLTRWSQVEESKMIVEFKENPGTIWGFEDIRMPYVDCAHEVDEVDQPLRMMELWTAVMESLSPEAFDRLLEDPKNAVGDFIDKGVKELANSRDPMIKKLAESEDFIKNFKKDAEAFLLEFATQMPKATFARPTLDDAGEKAAMTVSEVAGIKPDKFVTGLACKAGLWWAKKENKPVYYCLDGINMADVTNYKKVKKKAVEDFLNADGKGHDEVITLVELREILKNWKQFEGTVKFVEKGNILQGKDLEQKVKGWQKDLRKANKQAGRMPAPDFKVFTNDLNKIDGGLLVELGKQKDVDKANMDARDIVKKYGYLVKVANTRPHIVLEYISNKCGVLIEYKLIAPGLPQAGRALRSANRKKNEENIKDAKESLGGEIGKCHKDFRKPLKAALLPVPTTDQKI